MPGSACAVGELLRLLTPWEVPGLTKRRYGNKAGDGGYVYLRELLTNQPVISAGIGVQITFDQEIAALGHNVFMYDHTIDGPRRGHTNFKFHKAGISHVSSPDDSMLSIEHILTKHIGGNRNDIVLKMDIEGAEWPSLNAVPHEAMRRFSMLSFEFHEFHKIGDASVRAKMMPVLEKLAKDFTLFHVHANNSRPLAIVSGFTVAAYFELSYVRTDLVSREHNRTLYPSPIDPPNVGRAELPLWFYPFLPLGPDAARVEEGILAMARRMDAVTDLLEKQGEVNALRQRVAQLEAELAGRPVATTP